MRREFGIPLDLPGCSGRIQPEFHDAVVIRSLEKGSRLFETPGCRTLLEGRNRIASVKLRFPDGIVRDVVVKEFRIQGIDKWKNLLCDSKALRAWRGAHASLAAEISTPAPVAYLERKEGFFLEEAFFIYVMEKNVEEIRFLFRRLEGRDLRKLLEDLARFLGKVHQRGILHRDLSDGNILAGKRGAEDWAFSLIDTNRIRVRETVGRVRGVRNLIRLGVPASEQAHFLGCYLQNYRIGRGIRIWYRLNKNVYAGTIRVKKKLRLRRLAQKLRIQ